MTAQQFLTNFSAPACLEYPWPLNSKSGEVTTFSTTGFDHNVVFAVSQQDKTCQTLDTPIVQLLFHHFPSPKMQATSYSRLRVSVPIFKLDMQPDEKHSLPVSAMCVIASHGQTGRMQTAIIYSLHPGTLDKHQPTITPRCSPGTLSADCLLVRNERGLHLVLSFFNLQSFVDYRILKLPGSMGVQFIFLVEHVLPEVLRAIQKETVGPAGQCPLFDLLL